MAQPKGAARRTRIAWAVGAAQVEFGISHLKQQRAMATRYGKLAVRDEATIFVAAINEWIAAI